MGIWNTISSAIYREYDRRIKRASLITEYGAAHHASHDDAHGADGHEDAEEAEIANVPRGTAIVAPVLEQPAPSDTTEARS
jgi:hypothetical protein